MSFEPGQRARIEFPEGHENAQMNGMTGKITHRVTELPSGWLYNVWMDTLFGALAMGESHLRPLEESCVF